MASILLHGHHVEIGSQIAPLPIDAKTKKAGEIVVPTAKQMRREAGLNANAPHARKSIGQLMPMVPLQPPPENSMVPGACPEMA